jgi:predicted small secreted protein
MKLISTLLVAVFVLAGCNTVRGFGQDVQKAGGALENASKK